MRRFNYDYRSSKEAEAKFVRKTDQQSHQQIRTVLALGKNISINQCK